MLAFESLRVLDVLLQQYPAFWLLLPAPDCVADKFYHAVNACRKDGAIDHNFIVQAVALWSLLVPNYIALVVMLDTYWKDRISRQGEEAHDKSTSPLERAWYLGKEEYLEGQATLKIGSYGEEESER